MILYEVGIAVLLYMQQSVTVGRKLTKLWRQVVKMSF